VARGPGRSRPEDQVVEEVRGLVELGYREVVLSGVHLGSYGHDLGDRVGLHNLVRRLLTDTELPRLRLSSLEPWNLDAALIALFEDPRLLPHLHLPLQSGSDRVLRLMGRRGDRAGFADLVEMARSTIEDLSISTDVMVGFPGESEADFLESLAFAEKMSFSRLHVFRYSRREGTVAAGMPDQVPGPVAAERSRRFLELGNRLERDFDGRFVGSTLPVLWEDHEQVGARVRWSGLTDNYIRVRTETGPEVDLTNRVTPTRLVSTIRGGLAGLVSSRDLPTSSCSALAVTQSSRRSS
jgi:threonylcarbamoyladenosine tRNA methylthiotransferase MtaB